ncbi:solute carrier family 2, facilitated glucose transporter member 5 [Tachysurus fulvidraco]|uniref:solute carrier family 2, facilitated glucose transporter member 5 n=1 Tax=Tachysurus fulvidraco TaxID=1234273 RepID=UPI000F508340|nr:solute carrier family 2, facilitated glucose transporter member 5 [Tachysurus fulvidraco]
MEDLSERKGKLTLLLAFTTLISAFGSSFQYGYNVAVINSPAPDMKSFYINVFESRNSTVTNDMLTLLWSLTVSMYPLGGFFGSLMVAPLVNNFGRKGTLLFNNIFSIGPAIMMGVSEVLGSFEIIIVGRFFVGICAGISSNVVPMYLGELAPRNLRGAIGIVPQLFITIGILTAQVFGIRNILGNAEGWPILLGLTGVPALIELLLLPFCPESPRYMLIQRGDDNNGKIALQRLRGWKDVEEEMTEMRLEEQSERAEGQLTVLKLFTFRSLRWQLLSIIIINMGQQLSGVNAIYYYADSIFSSAGVKVDHVQYVTVGTGSVNVLMTIGAVFIVEASGRKLLLLIGFGICCLACVILTVALSLQDTMQWMPYVSIACVIIYVIGHAIGPSPIPTVITTEIFRQSSRPAAFMVAGSVHWLSNFTIGLVFPFLEKNLGAFSFIVFAGICLATLIYIWVVIPETKGATFLEISKLFAKKNKVEILVEDEDCQVQEAGVTDHEKDIITAF